MNYIDPVILEKARPWTQPPSTKKREPEYNGSLKTTRQSLPSAFIATLNSVQVG